MNKQDTALFELIKAHMDNEELMVAIGMEIADNYDLSVEEESTDEPDEDMNDNDSEHMKAYMRDVL